MEQGKLVGVLSGEIFDVAVDIRKESPFYGHWISVKLSFANNNLLWIPPGFAHGFYTLENQTTVIYKTTNYYSSSHEKTLNWSDKNLGIQWNLDLSLIHI